MKKIKNNTTRIGEIEILRFLFCIVVIMYHCNLKIFDLIGKTDFRFSWAPRGYIGVEFFFIVSGYFFAYSLSKINYRPLNEGGNSRDYIRLMWNKYIGIFPCHLIAFVLLFAANAYVLRDLSNLKLLDVLPGLLLIQRAGISFNCINGVEWYISAMLIAMAIIAPIAVKYGDLYKRYFAPLSALLIYGWLTHEFHMLANSSAWTAIGYRSVWRAIAGINLGIFAAECVKQLKKHNFSKAERFTAHLVRYTLFAFAALYAMRRGDKKYDALIAFAIFLALVLTFTFAFSSSKLFQNGFVMFLGKLSLPMYLNQYLAIIIVTEVFPNKSHLVTFVLITAIDIAVSIPTLYASKPLLTAIKKSKLNKMITT